jgi:hypothetical protein
LRRRLTLERFLPLKSETRLMVFVVAGLFVVSVAVTLIVLLAGTGSRSRPPEGAVLPVPAVSAGTQAKIEIGDLLLPEDVQNPLREPQPATTPPYLLRPRMSRWSDEQVQRYWIPLEEIAIERIKQENDRRIEALFEGVP